MRTATLLSAACVLVALLGNTVTSKLSSASYFYNKQRPLVIAHRGASGQFPEHTMAAYTSAYFNGADFVELDLQLSKDGHLIVSHDPCLRETTNIDSYEWLWGSRKSDHYFSPYAAYCRQDYLIHDFTLEEIKMLRRKARYHTRNQYFNQEYEMVTLEETIELLLGLNAQFPKKDGLIGLYIETKMFNFYNTTYQLDIVEKLYEVLKRYDIETVEKATSKLPIILECFEQEAIIRMGELTDLPTVYLMFFENPFVSYNVTEISKIAHGVGPSQDWIMDDDRLNNETSKFIDECHAADLAVHPYSLQDDFLRWTKTPLDEVELFITKGIDGIFTEFPHTTHAAFTKFKSTNTFPGDKVSTQ